MLCPDGICAQVVNGAAMETASTRVKRNQSFQQPRGLIGYIRFRGTLNTRPVFSVGHLLSAGVALRVRGLDWKAE